MSRKARHKQQRSTPYRKALAKARRSSRPDPDLALAYAESADPFSYAPIPPPPELSRRPSWWEVFWTNVWLWFISFFRRGR